MQGGAINEKSGGGEIISLFIFNCLLTNPYLPFWFLLGSTLYLFPLTPMDKTAYTQGHQETSLATEQENADIARKNIELEALLEERKNEIKKIQDESDDYERRLEVALLLSAQQGLANLDMQMKVDLMRLGNLQLVSGHNFYFYFHIHIHPIDQEKALEEKQANESKSFASTDA